jgi:SAM-dependent methyltransferase
MADSPHSDRVAQQYERWTYPQPIPDLEAWLTDNWQWFDPSHAHRIFWPDRPYTPEMEILVAGCGTNQAAVFALNNPKAHVVAIDVSVTSLQNHVRLRDRHGLDNLEIRRMPVEEAGSMGHHFDLIVSTGVLHHLEDPVRGLRSLAGCLKPQGVAALMLYARYGRIGVEMLQSVFRDLGLGFQEASIPIIRDALEGLPSDHPVASYLGIAPDLGYDAGLVDTFLHVRERSYTVEDCLGFVDAAGLAFQDFFFKAPYHPPPWASGPFLSAVSAQPPARQWSIMERVQFNNGCHFFMACRPDRPKETYQVDFEAEGASRFVPFLRHRCRLDGNRLHRSDWSIPLESDHLALVRLIDGRRTLGEDRRIADPGS